MTYALTPAPTARAMFRARQQEAHEKASRAWDDAVAAWDLEAKLPGGDTLSLHLGQCIAADDWDRVYTVVMREASAGDRTCIRILSNAKEQWLRHHPSGDAA